MFQFFEFPIFFLKIDGRPTANGSSALGSTAHFLSPFLCFFAGVFIFQLSGKFITLAGHSSFSVATVPTTTTLEPVVRRTEKRRKKNLGGR
jgi:hypothetical protein